MPGKGRMQITGKLGDVMQESIKAAKSFIISKSLDYLNPYNKTFAPALHLQHKRGTTPMIGDRLRELKNMVQRAMMA
jgi:ATP-dependent Lon protease